MKETSFTVFLNIVSCSFVRHTISFNSGICQALKMINAIAWKTQCPITAYEHSALHQNKKKRSCHWIFVPEICTWQSMFWLATTQEKWTLLTDHLRTSIVRDMLHIVVSLTKDVDLHGKGLGEADWEEQGAGEDRNGTLRREALFGQGWVWRRGQKQGGGASRKGAESLCCHSSKT